MDPRERTVSADSTTPRHLSAASSAGSASRKSRSADIDMSSAEVVRASLSMPPPPRMLHPRNSPSTPSRRSSRVSEIALPSGMVEQPAEGRTNPVTIEDGDTDEITPKMEGMSKDIAGSTTSLPIAVLPTGMRRSEPDLESNRMSFSSLYNFVQTGFNQARTGRVEANGSSAPPGTTTATSALSVTTSSQNGALSPSLSSSLHEPVFRSSSQPNPLPSQTLHNPTSVPRQPRVPRGRTPHYRPVSGTTTATNSASPSSEHTNGEEPPVIGTIGICALDAKARSKPSRNILSRLLVNNDFKVVVFGDKVILDETIENWPLCDFLISFFSDGFPLEKAIHYAELRRPFCVNDLPMQTILWDRRICLQILDRLGVLTPARVEVNRDGGPTTLTPSIADRLREKTGVVLFGSADGRGGGEPPPNDVHMEDDNDTIVVEGRKLRKPFVEKPVSGEDHNINIYYPKLQGGGGRRLFRKVNNKSSEKDETLVVPRSITEPNSSYIYEQFLKVENAEDVKAYTVGPDYCHAETRKSPVVDGLVKRNPNGKEIRYVTSLLKEEQIIAAKIAEGFGQRVCGFDLLRVGDESYVIDVNGWSFVKDNNEYYDRCASKMKSMFIQEKRKKDGLPVSSDSETENKPPASAPSSQSKDVSHKKMAGRDDGHRSALKLAFRSRSISQLRDSVTGRNPDTSPTNSVATTPLTNPPSFERNLPIPKRAPTIPVSKTDILPPPAARKSFPPDTKLEPPNPSEIHPAASTDNLAPAPSVPAPASKSQWKLKGMVAVIRHADRTPKQKFKFTFHTKPFVDLLKGHQEEVLLVGEAALNSVQEAVRQAMREGEEDAAKLRTLSNALARKGAWLGTKVQIKPMFRKPNDANKEKNKEREKASPISEDEQSPAAQVHPPDFPPSDTDGATTKRVQKRQDSLSEVTLSRTAAAENNLVLDKLQLVMKWGGEPTHSARYQAADLGDNMRNDLLLMNRRALADVSLFTSSERRVTTSAQIFAAAFLAHDHAATHHPVTVRKDLLDDSNAAKDEMDRVKKKLKGLLRAGKQAPAQFAWPKDGTPEPYLVVREVVELMKFHRKVLRHNFGKLQGGTAVSALEKVAQHPPPAAAAATADAAGGSGAPEAPGVQQTAVQARWCAGEDAALFRERWEKLFDEFTDAEKVDPSKISELYDTMKFDALHNRQFLEWVFTPSRGMIAAEDDEGRGLQRTMSGVAREEFALTHQGEVGTPVGEERGGAGQGKATMGLVDKPGEKVEKEKERDKGSMAHRMGFRRKSETLLAESKAKEAGKVAQPPQPDPSESYFSLFTGNHGVSESKAKVDARLGKLRELYRLSKVLFDFIGPQEYGILDSEKLEIGLLTSLPLLKEIVHDLEEVQASDHAKSFIYFTKESHIYTLLNCILEGGITTKIARNAIPELDYLSQICFELYESENGGGGGGGASTPSDRSASSADNAADDALLPRTFNYSIRITLSPGCHTFDPLDVQLDSKHCIGCAPRRSLTPHGEWKEVLETLRAKFHTVKLPKSFLAVNLSETVPLALEQEEQEEGSVGMGDGVVEAAEKW